MEKVIRKKKCISKKEYNLVTEKVEVYLNWKRMVFNEGLQPKSIAGVAYLPLEVMTKAVGFDMEMSMDMLPNIVVEGPDGKVKTSFKAIQVETPTALNNLNGRVTLATDLSGKYIGTHIGSNFFDNLGFITSNELSKPDMSSNVVVHTIKIDGKLGYGGKLTFKEKPIVVVLHSLIDYVIKPNKP